MANWAGVVRKIPKQQAPTLQLQKYKQVFLGPFDIVILSLTLTLTLTIEGNKLCGKGGKDGSLQLNENIFGQNFCRLMFSQLIHLPNAKHKSLFYKLGYCLQVVIFQLNIKS